MCTSIVYRAGDSYFGRNLDLEVSLGQKVVITPRDYSLKFRNMPTIDHHYAIIGVSLIRDNYPLYLDGANEEGVGMACLNFDGPCRYFPVESGKDNVASFEFIPYILSQCKNIAEAKQLLAKLNLTNISFSPQLQCEPLHWIIADRSGASVVVESTATGLHFYDNPVGVLANNPEFPQQLTNLANYQDISPTEPVNNIAPGVNLNTYSRGLGSHHLPGGMDSESRFVKETFVKAHAPKGQSEAENVTNYFHCLHAVEQQKNLDEVAPQTFEYTIYSDGINLSTGTLYYTHYDNNRINAVSMRRTNLNSTELISYPMAEKQSINYQN